MSFWRHDVIQPALERDVEAGVREQQALLRREPNNARAHFALATFRHFQGGTDEAIALFQRAIELEPHFAAPHVSLGRIYAVQGHYGLAWKHAREAERLGDRSLIELLEGYPNLK